jgi:uncharacterized membrane protein
MKTKKLFWPIVFISAGIIIMLNSLFNLHIRLNKLIFAVILIYIGISIMTGKRRENPAAFSEDKRDSDKYRNYSYVFGSGDVDLTDIQLYEENVNVKVDIVFGTGRIRLKEGTPAVIKMESYFASTNYRGENIIFGDKTVKTPSYIDGQPFLNIRVSTIFGSADIDIIN